ncbi:glycoside hydrolase family 3 N-terminal domain-containing protein [Caldisericum exile]|uniref:beta-N-acetylhexosaminidase n=1 Tax=Caldisericum exile (strain DSM 21853 / NBRC 104410 / AZM16c01) TaxID=511051 RepID=A0A7U6GDR0_CALEA|nr:glycoside hydrolase family 3 N-terminal domain-containing protein [Caldisericum exile]BAL80427.1 putative glycosidase [Caldisericum exile AZM16c01]
MNDIGKIFLFGFEESVISLERLKFFKSVGAKNFILFKRNIERLEENIDILKNEFDNPIISVDGEGGIVRRISEFDDFMFSNMNIGSSFDPLYAKETYFKMGKILFDKGINMNLAPVVDVYLSDGNTIGIRSFGSFEDAVSEFSINAIEGLHASNVYAVAKHFIGYGGVKIDPHKTIPTFTLDYPYFERALKPFREVKDIADFIMTAHIIIPFLDNVPVTFSKNAISVLREFYTGPIMTDDLEMGGAFVFPPHEIPLKALLAGNDMLSVCSSFELQKLMVNEVEKAHLNLDPHIERIENIRKFEDSKVSEIPLREERYITLYKDIDFVGTENFKLIVLFSLSEHFKGEHVFNYSPDIGDEEKQRILDTLSSDDYVVITVYNAFDQENVVKFVKSIKNKVKKLCVILLGDPFDREYFLFSDCIILTYSPLPRIVDYALKVVKGEYEALGRLPV